MEWCVLARLSCCEARSSDAPPPRFQIGDDKKQDLGKVPYKLGLRGFLVQTGKYRPGDEGMTESGGRPEVVSTFADAVNVILAEL